jgi:Mg-chelatase subunit ChlD
MKSNVFKLVLGMMVFPLVLVFQNCSNAKFTPDIGSNALDAVTGANAGDDSSCRPGTVNSNKIVKVLFVVDTSGSNAGEDNQPPTDLQKKWRSATINSFFSVYNNRPNFYFGMITFQGSSAKAQIQVGNKGGFTQDSSVINDGYNSFLNTPDSGNTPYKAALSMAKSIISADLAAYPKQNAAYVLVMVSDGQATDYKSPDDVIPDASAIRALAPGQVSLNTVYYYSKAYVESQTKYLRNISSVGGGQFLVANSNQSLKIDDVIQVPGVSCQ